MAVKNMAASVLSRLKNQAKEEKISFQMVLQLFAQEEFLRKLSESDFADNLILKGGMFIYTLTGFDSRATRDIDFLLRDLHGSLENTESTMKKICQINTGNDFITLEVVGTEQISVEKKYPGIKTHSIFRFSIISTSALILCIFQGYYTLVLTLFQEISEVILTLFLLWQHHFVSVKESSLVL